jgi:hypothetical protein
MATRQHRRQRKKPSRANAFRAPRSGSAWAQGAALRSREGKNWRQPEIGSPRTSWRLAPHGQPTVSLTASMVPSGLPAQPKQ